VFPSRSNEKAKRPGSVCITPAGPLEAPSLPGAAAAVRGVLALRAITCCSSGCG
jgi:hypothetical protein